MEFIDEEIDIKYEYGTDDLDLDYDLGSSSHSLDWKLNPNVECSVMLAGMKSLNSDKEVLGDPDKNGVEETETSSEHNGSVDKSCDIYRKLKLLVDSLKNCEKRENCGLCEKYIRQLQEHLLLSHGDKRGEVHKKNSIETTASSSELVPVSLDPNHVPSEKNNLDLNIFHGDIDKNSGDELLPPLTIRSESEGESTFRKVGPNNINRKSTPKGGKSKPYKCDTCEMTFLIFYDLTQHKTIHIEEKQDNVRGTGTPLNQPYSKQRGLPNGCLKKRFECDVCRKVFSGSSDFNRHKRIHTGEKPYKCDVCGNCFTRNFSLTEHKLTHTGEKPHKCEQCGKCFTHRSNLIQHVRTHSGGKPAYKCEQCGKCFTQSSYLIKHARTHTGENPHKCELCGKCFKSQNGLSRHKLIHTRQERHK